MLMQWHVGKKCRELNIPNRLVFCQTETGGYHLILEVNGYVLDNRYPKVMKNNEVPYKWMRISGYNSGDPWHEIIEEDK